MSQPTSVILPAGAVLAVSRPVAGALPAPHVEADAAECGRARTAHLLGLFGILGTGAYYLLKRNEAGAFARDQMREAFNFHLFVFVVAVVLGIVGGVAGSVAGGLAVALGLVWLAVGVGAVVLSVRSALRAARGQVARYPARIRC